MSPLTRTLLTLGCIAFPLAALYCFLSGYLGAGLFGVGAFLFTFFTAVQLTPPASKVCPKCGRTLRIDEHDLV